MQAALPAADPAGRPSSGFMGTGCASHSTRGERRTRRVCRGGGACTDPDEAQAARPSHHSTLCTILGLNSGCQPPGPSAFPAELTSGGNVVFCSRTSLSMTRPSHPPGPPRHGRPSKHHVEPRARLVTDVCSSHLWRPPLRTGMSPVPFRLQSTSGSSPVSLCGRNLRAALRFLRLLGYGMGVGVGRAESSVRSSLKSSWVSLLSTYGFVEKQLQVIPLTGHNRTHSSGTHFHDYPLPCREYRARVSA